jgi:molecular chaperone DnaK
MIQELVRQLGGGKEPNKGVNPDEVVAVGAAIQAGVLGGEVKDVVLLDVIPLSLGLWTLGDVFDKLIERNTPVPTRVSRVYTTAQDGQTSVEIKVYQGEREIASQNKFLGTFQLSGIPPAPRGIPQIEVTFDVDANSILSVSAKDLATGKMQSVTISGSSNLNEAEVERLVREAEQYAEQDRRQRERAEARNKAESLVLSVERGLNEIGDSAPADARQEVEEALRGLREAMKGSDLDEIMRRTETLQGAQYRMTTAMYQRASSPAAAPDDTSTDDEEGIEA